MKTNIMKRMCLLISIIVISFLFLTQKLSAADEIKGFYSGWGLGEAFSDIARKGNLNIVGDFGDKKISNFNLTEYTYIEEAMNLLAKAHGMVMRKADEVWVAMPEKFLKNQEEDLGICKHFAYQAAAALQKPLTEIAGTNVKTWFPPMVDGVAVIGSKEWIDEIKKVIETVDTPDYGIKIHLELSEEGNNVVASCSFISMSKVPFRLIFDAGKNGELAFELNGVAKVNDECIISLEQQSNFKISGTKASFSQISVKKENEKDSHEFSLNGKRLTLSWQTQVLRLRGHIKSKSPQPEVKVAGKAKETTQEFRHYTVVSGPQSPLLDEPLILDNVSLPSTLEKLAAEEKIPVILDKNVTGNVSAYCYGKRLDKQDLIKTMAAVKGLVAHKNEDGYTITTPKDAQNLEAADKQSFTSPVLHRINAPAAIIALSEWFKQAKIEASVSPIKGNRIEVVAPRAVLSPIEVIVNEWATPAAQFQIGVKIDTTREQLTGSGLISKTLPLKKAWERTGLKVHTVVNQRLGNYEDGLRQLDYVVNAAGQSNERWLIQSSMLLPENGPFEFFKSEKKLPFRAVIDAAFARTQEANPFNLNNSKSSFDDAFDQGF